MFSPLSLTKHFAVSAAILLTAVTFPANSLAQTKPKAEPPPPKKGKPAPAPNKEIGVELKLIEADELRGAYIAMAGGNHDYDGHRVKAMHAVKEAVKILDTQVMEHGNAAQKAKTKQGDILVANADKAAKAAKMFHEPQPASDAALRGAAATLIEIRKVLAERRQPRVLTHVETAIKEIEIALKIR
jgi:hypothetical protein